MCVRVCGPVRDAGDRDSRRGARLARKGAQTPVSAGLQANLGAETDGADPAPPASETAPAVLGNGHAHPAGSRPAAGPAAPPGGGLREGGGGGNVRPRPLHRATTRWPRLMPPR